MNNNLINSLIDIAIKEDIGDGDHSSLSCIPESSQGKAQLLIKENGILSGSEIAKLVFHKIDTKLKFSNFISDGSLISIGDIAFTVEGKVQSILKAERLVLNIMQRMSGIATTTNIYVKKIEGYKTKLLDTRKTTPGMRILEKIAVKTGGGENHRMGLYDMIMLKDNHIDFAGGIKQAINKTQKYKDKLNKEIKIEIEVRNIQEIEEIITIGGVDRIMLDNFTPEETRKAVSLINGRYETESSGGISIDTLLNYAKCGVDYISVGALTHQIKSLDMSLKAMY
jgi:nicotinate-nucleotide pyrophosphorylase (carboxylating)